MGSENVVKQKKFTEMDTEFELEYQKGSKVKTKELTLLFWNKFIVSDCSTRFFFRTCRVLKTWLELRRVKVYRNDLKGNKNYFELAGPIRVVEGSIYRG